MNPAVSSILPRFHELFGPDGSVRLVRAPGRVNLIGEHTDYNEGFVFPMAIEPQVCLAIRARADSTVRLASSAFAGEIVEFDLARKIERGEPSWANYVRGVAAELIAAGIPLGGMDALITNTLPVGGGLSSSAALEVGSGLAFLTLAGLQMEPMRLALICQKAEHEYALVPCGLMDQMIVATANEGNATLFDCRDGSRQYVSLEAKELRIVIANSMVRHELASGEYAARRRQCEQAAAWFQKENPSIRSLRDVTLPQIQAAQRQGGAGGRGIDETVLKRARHVVTENARTTAAAAALGRRRYEEAGQLMLQSHASLRDDYEVSCPELDFLVEQAMQVKGVYGARMTGGGCGGCIVALTQPRAVEPLEKHLTAAYEERFNLRPQIIPTTATAGASVVT
jgi:galactokinase